MLKGSLVKQPLRHLAVMEGFPLNICTQTYEKDQQAFKQIYSKSLIEVGGYEHSVRRLLDDLSKKFWISFNGTTFEFSQDLNE